MISSVQSDKKVNGFASKFVDQINSYLKYMAEI